MLNGLTDKDCETNPYQQERQEKYDLEFSQTDIYMYRAAFAIPVVVVNDGCVGNSSHFI